jgi:uncharacterized protein YkwD
MKKLFIFVVSLMVVCAGCARKKTSFKDISPVPSAEELIVVEKTNEERVAKGLHVLFINDSLMQSAKLQALRMAEKGQLNHVLGGPKDYRTVVNRVNYFDYSFSTVGENIAYGQTPLTVVDDWMNSPGHRANILNPEFREIGVGINFASDGTPYFCQVFGTQ